MKKFLLIIPFLVLFSSQAWAAFAQVHTSTQATGTGSTVAITTTATTANNLVVVTIRLANAAVETCSSVTDDKSNTYVLSALKNSDNGVVYVYQAYGVQVTGGTTTITCHFSGTVTSKRCGADEFSGGATTNASVFDTQQSGTGSGLTLSVSTLTPANTGELIVASMSTHASNYTAGSGFTMYNGTNPVSTRSEYKLSGGATETAPATVDGTSDSWCEIATAFKLAAGAAVNTSAGFFGE